MFESKFNLTVNTSPRHHIDCQYVTILHMPPKLYFRLTGKYLQGLLNKKLNQNKTKFSFDLYYDRNFVKWSLLLSWGTSGGVMRCICAMQWYIMRTSGECVCTCFMSVIVVVMQRSVPLVVGQFEGIYCEVYRIYMWFCFVLVIQCGPVIAVNFLKTFHKWWWLWWWYDGGQNVAEKKLVPPYINVTTRYQQNTRSNMFLLLLS